jgi:hypothetical protein
MRKKSNSRASRGDNVALASKFGVRPQTISLWRQYGAPLDDEEAMGKWLATRGKKSAVRIPLDSAGEPTAGAASALKRLEGAELALHTKLQALMADDQADPGEVAASWATWLRVGDSLRRYDVAVVEARRDSGALVPREILEAYAKGFVLNFVGKARADLETACPRLAGQPGPAEVWAVLHPIWRKALEHATKAMADCPYDGQTAPRWLVKAVQEVIESNVDY